MKAAARMCVFTRQPSWTAGVSPALTGGGTGAWTAGAASPASSPAPSSPDRVDALVWALTELPVQPMPHAGMFELCRDRAATAAQR